MRAKRELRLFLSVAAIVLLLAFIFFSYAQQQDTTKSSVPILTEVEKRFTPKAGEKPKETPSLSEVERRFLPREQESPKEIPALSGVERKFLPRGGPFPLEVAQLPEVGWPEVREFKDFKGGLNLSSYKTKVAPNQAIVLENALWNEQGEMYKRPGCSEHSTPPFDPNFLYRYYKQDGKKFTMGGSDTSLHFWHEDSSGDGWTYLIGTGGTSGRWDGTTFEDMFVGTHEGIEPVIWDGANFHEMGVSIDSFQVIKGGIFWHADSSSVVCGIIESTFVWFDPIESAFEVNEWVEYTVGYWGKYYKGPPGSPVGNYSDTVFLKSFIRSNSESDLTIYSNLHFGYPISNSGGNYYAKIYAWFGEGEVWRKGTVDVSEHCQYIVGGLSYHHNTRIIDSSFYWDSTTVYNDYVFEVISGEGKGKKCWMRNYGRDMDCSNNGWDSQGFIVPIYHDACFDTTTYYRIYQPKFAGEGGKLVENYDDRCWIGWAGINEVDSVATVEVSDSSFTGEDTTVASIDTTIDSIDPICGDSVQFQGSTQRSSAVPCPHCSTMLAVSYGSITPGEYGDSAISLPVRVYSDASELAYDTLTRYVRIDSNTFTSCYLTFSNSPCAEGKVLYEYPWTYYAKFFFIDTIGTEWREGTVDSATTIGSEGTWLEQCHTRLWDDTYAWDSTLSYNDYYFVVYAGKGVGIKTFLFNHVPCPACAVGWEGDGFLVPNYSSDCFDNTTQYKIYEPNLTADCYIETTFSYDTTWEYSIVWEYYTTTVYDTVYTDDQDKNVLIYSELPEDGGLGNWPPENEVYLTPGDGDYITGMISLSDARHVDVPSHLLMVSKNASSYKIIPTSTAGLYDSWYISTRVGCVSNSAMSVGEGLVLFPDQSGVWAWDQRSKPQCISLLIDPIFEDLDLANLEDMSAIYNPQDRHYYLSGPELFDEAYSGGEFICVFEMDQDQTTDGYWIHEFDATGDETGDDVRKLGAAYAAIGGYLDIAAKDDGEYAIMFKQSSGNPAWMVFLAFFDEDGVQIGDTLRIDNGGGNGYANNDDHKLDMNNAGQIIACWTDTEDAFDDVRCQIVHFDSGLVGSNFNVNSDHASNIDDYVSWGVGINEEGVAVIAWEDQRDVANVTEIYAQRFQYPDSLMDANFRVNSCWAWIDDKCVPCLNPVCDGANCCEGEFKPAVAVGPRTFVIAWMSNGIGDHARCAGGSCLYKRSFNIDGTAREGEMLISDCVGGNIQEPSVSINSKGNYVIAYDKECGDGATYAIYMTAFDSSDGVHLSERQVSVGDESQQGPDVSINNNDIIVVVWYDGYHDVAVEIAYRSYDWNGALMASDVILSSSAYCQYPEIDCFLNPPDTSLFTLAWNIDYHGWSKETFSASAYAYQHGLTDPVKVIFADPEDTKVYNYATQADDVGNAVILTYQSPYLSFVQNPSWDVVMSYATLEAFLDTGAVYIYWYKDYSELVHVDTISCGGDCREEIQLPPDVTGHNISMKIVTGAEIDDFTLSGYWWEYLINRWRK